MGLLDRLRVPLGWLDVVRRTVRRTIQDNCLGWAGELAYFFFLALFPALLFFVALASFFPIHQLTDQVLTALARFGAFFASAAPLMLTWVPPPLTLAKLGRMTLTSGSRFQTMAISVCQLASLPLKVRTMALISICCNMLITRQFRKNRAAESVRGTVLATVGLSIVWIIWFGQEIYTELQNS